MGYLGNAPARSFISFERQVFTIVNSQTAYTLSHSVTNENDIRLVINNVVQEPGSGKAYTASGTTLTLSAALTNGTDEMYCVFLGRAVGTVNAPAGSVDTAQLAADAVTGAKIADDAISDEHLDPTAITGQTAETTVADDDLILLSDTSASAALKKMTRANFVSGIGGVTMSDSWILNDDVTISGSNVLLNTSSLVQSSVATTGFIGTGVSYSSGYFTFPSTGIYQITAYYDVTTTTSQDVSLKIWTTTDNSTYVQRTTAYTYAVANQLVSGVQNFIFDVTDTSTHKVGLYYYAVGGGTTKLRGNSSQAETQITFLKLGET